LVADFLHEVAVQAHVGVRVVLGDVADLAALLVVPADLVPVHGRAHVGIGDGFGHLVGGNARQLVDGPIAYAQAAVADGAAGVGDHGVADGDRLAGRVHTEEVAVVAEDALLGRALAAPEVDGDVGLDVDDVQGLLRLVGGDVGGLHE